MNTDHNLIFLTYPIGAAMAQDLQRWQQVYPLIEKLPPTVVTMVTSGQTAAFLRGLAKEAGVPIERVSRVAFAVVQVAIGEIPLAQLPGILSSRVGVGDTRAQAMAREIEKELFVPYMLEWNAWLEQLKREAEEAKAKQGQVGAQNVIDLKNRPSKTPKPNAQNPTKP